MLCKQSIEQGYCGTFQDHGCAHTHQSCVRTTSMTFRIVRSCGALACAIQHLLKRSLGKLPLPTLLLAHERMSWAFGIKRQASQQDTKSPETSEQAIEKLQGFHQLVKVLLLQ